MTTFAVQYLGSRPKEATPKNVREKLLEAFLRLPISMVIVDWDLPPALEEAVAEETRANNAKLYRWQTWLTADSQVDLPVDWAVINANNVAVNGYENDPDFTFICPNHPAVQEFLQERLDVITTKGLFQGIFLDRIRFPSPAINPESNMGCFCSYCRRLAADRGLDLEVERRNIGNLLKSKKGVVTLCRSLLGEPFETGNPLKGLLDFREQSITRTVENVRRQAVGLDLELGLDCYSPTLTRMVGQDLKMSRNFSDWIKIMTYPRVFGPAGISFELLGLLDWMIDSGLSEGDSLAWLERASGLALPPGRTELRWRGLDSGVISTEIQHGRSQSQAPLLGGIALVEVKGIHESTPEKIRADLLASQAADGLVLSWDLWQIPLRTLDLIHQLWEI